MGIQLTARTFAATFALSLAVLSGWGTGALAQATSDVNFLIRQSDVIAMPDITIDLDAPATQKYAIVIGNGDYETIGSLRNTRRDARAIASVLRDGGYIVNQFEDVTKRGFEAAMRQILFDVEKGADLLIYFAGHGVQIGRENYLLPVDAAVTGAYDVPFEAVSLTSLLSIAGARARSLTVILDSCRNNPFEGRTAVVSLEGQPAEMRTGFSPQDTPINSLVVFSTSPGAVAADGEGDHSPFTQALLDVIAAQPGAPLDGLLKQVRRRVYQATGGQQVPWESSSLVESIALSSDRPPLLGDVASWRDPEAQSRDVALRTALHPEIGIGVDLAELMAGNTADFRIVSSPANGRLEVSDGTKVHALPEGPLTAAALAGIQYRQITPQADAETLDGATFTDNFRIAMADGPRAVTLEMDIDPCDLAAGDYLDPDGVGIGRRSNEIDPDAARAACAAAVAANPDVGRFYYQLGRAFMGLQDIDAAEAAFLSALDRGHTRAYQALGSVAVLRAGTQGRAAPQEALSWYARGVARGDPYAFHSLGRQLLLFGETVAEREQGFSLLSRALELGHTFSMNALGLYFLEDGSDHYDPQRGLRYLRESAAREDIYGYANLGYVYREGIAGVEQSFETALDWYKRAADGRHPNAPASIARMYNNGQIGGRPDYVQAIRWNEEGLKRGDPWAGANAAAIVLRRKPAGYSEFDAGVFAAKASVLRNKGARDSANRSLGKLSNRALDGAAQSLMASLGAEISIDGAFGPASQVALDALAAQHGKTFSTDPAVRLAGLAKLHWQLTRYRGDIF